MHFEIDTARAKAIARAIAKRCKTHGAEIAYGQALDGLAAGLGLTDWNTLSAKLKTGDADPAPTPPDRVAALPGGDTPIPGTAASDDGVRQARFDVRRYLADQSDEALAETLRSFVAVDFARDYAIDHVVRDAADDPDQTDAAALLDWCADADVGFEGEVSGVHTLAWVRLFRPTAYAHAMRKAGTEVLEVLRTFERQFARGAEAVEDSFGDSLRQEIQADLAAMRAAAGTPGSTPLPDRPAGAEDDSPSNTRIVYQYRDADNYKAIHSVILPGTLDAAETNAIRANLDEYEFFIPGQVGLPDLQDSFQNCASYWHPEKDHPWHELLRIETTTSPASVTDTTARDFAARFAATAWDSDYLPPFYETMRQRYENREAALEDQTPPERDRAVKRALDMLGYRKGPGPHALQPEGRQMRGYRFRDAQGDPALLLVHEANGVKRMTGWRDQPLGESSWSEAESMVFAMASGWNLTPEPKREPVPEAVAETVEGAPKAVADYLSSPPSFHSGALKMLVFVAETARSLQARGYSFERPDGTVAPIGGAKLPDGIAFDGAVELRTSEHDWEAAEALLYAEMAAQGYTPY